MILTTIEHLCDYEAINPYFPAAFRALKNAFAMPFQAGRTEVDAHTFLNAFTYETKPEEESILEAHRQKIDVMLMMDGEEWIGVCPLSEMGEEVSAYTEEGDAGLWKLPAQGTFSRLHMRRGTVAILFPEDAHAPGITVKTQCRIQKIIAKVDVSQ